jgi:predicted Na+-dependent transporter
VLLFAVTSLALGWLLGGPTSETRRSFAISAGARDLALALMMANLAFAERNVELATFAVWAVLLLFDLAFVEIVRHRPLREAHAV